MRKLKRGIALLLGALLLMTAALADEPMTSATEETMENGHVIYLAGGCFWGLGEADAVHSRRDGRGQSGYANGSGEADANYQNGVSTGRTGFRETVQVDV